MTTPLTDIPTELEKLVDELWKVQARIVISITRRRPLLAQEIDVLDIRAIQERDLASKRSIENAEKLWDELLAARSAISSHVRKIEERMLTPDEALIATRELEQAHRSHSQLINADYWPIITKLRRIAASSTSKEKE